MAAIIALVQGNGACFIENICFIIILYPPYFLKF